MIDSLSNVNLPKHQNHYHITFTTHANAIDSLLLPRNQLKDSQVTIYSAITLSNSPQANDSLGSVGLDNEHESKLDEEVNRAQSPPPQYPVSEISRSAPTSPRPPPFSSLYTSTAEVVEAYKTAVTEAGASASVPAYAPVAPEPSNSRDRDVSAETKAALPQDTKGESSKKDEDSEPPPAYSEGSSPLESFTYLMAAAGGAASIITQVQQGGAPPINTLGGRTRSNLHCR